ncbi:hypothetical protein BCR32DRAFT_293309 [Anaeromyces robustus]|uniref:Glycosyltransferase family 17 protein n=1 Tax=Anaeromyces robustus TaxID=1754192 RepID=A0A1Y1X6Q4_9FUNG|nr:hypothetical protein BCR32DRAFT_293309 [Anaeromyces robustus]|eukprot:ORX81365.1 hypothetical protein BCR32DRAFT_293309 [Anaeromyces robustus]
MDYSYTYLDSETQTQLLLEEGQPLKKKFRKNKIVEFIINYKKTLVIVCLILSFIGIGILNFIYGNHQKCIEPIITDEHYSIVKGEPNIDKYGIDLNQYITREMYSQKIPGINTLDNWKLYTPVCPHLEPVHYPEEILNPKCEDTGLQIVNFKNNLGRGVPHTLHLHNITNQIKNWNEWSKLDNKTVPNYYHKEVEKLIDDTYHPFDYGYYNEEETELKTEEDIISYYKNVINSRMDEVPDPRHRRLFSFILFNTEFDLLDVYLTQYYEIFDYFVIYESNSTLSGLPKPLYFTRMLLETDRYNKFKDKIITFPLFVDSVCKFHGQAFSKEHLARRQLIEMGLRAVQARHGDIFLHGDLDEFAKPHILTRIKKCGGWEHLQAGIGGGPQSTREKKVDSYLQDEELNRKLERDKYGFPKLVYDRELSLGFLNWFYEYSFLIVEDTTIGTTAQPDIAIFDARRALGQYPKRYNYTKSEGDGNVMVKDKYTKYNRRSEQSQSQPQSQSDQSNQSNQSEFPTLPQSEINSELPPLPLPIVELPVSNTTFKNNKIENENENDNYIDPLTQPGFDPYKGYSYTQNEDDRKKGEGYLGEYVRFTTGRPLKDYYDKEDTLIWSGGWHMSSFLPTIEHFVNKLLSYSHYIEYTYMSDEERKQEIINHINNKSYIFNIKSFLSKTEVVYEDNEILYPEDPEKGYSYDFSYETWHSFNTNINNIDVQNKYNVTTKLFNHEIPYAVWKNPICYSYMLDRQFGLTKKLWWQQIPKEEWSTVDFEKLDKEILEKIIPENLPENLKPKALRNNLNKKELN